MIRPAALLLAAALLAPGAAMGQGADRKPPLDQLLSALQVAPSEETAAALEASIRARWTEQASPAVRLLLTRGAREVGEGAAAEALDSFDAALDLEPELAEAWRGRAQARYRLGDTPGAVRDIQETLRREPRHFVALQDLSRMSEGTGDWRGALAAWEQALALNPRMPDGQARLRDLRRRALGEDT